MLTGWMKVLFMKLGNDGREHVGEVDHEFGFKQIEFEVCLDYLKGYLR